MSCLYILCFFFFFTSAHVFDFGLATSAFQIEGGWLEDNKAFTVWDNLEHTVGYVRDKSTAEVADDSYHKYYEDIGLLKEYGIKHYRLSIPWTRVMPRAVAGSAVNLKAVEYYRKLLKDLKNEGIVPYVNLFHNDMPAILVINGTGIWDPEFPDHFAYYANVSFAYFGDLVPYWFTFDEPWCQSVYDNLQKYDANTKPYMMAHNLLLAHAKAVKIYREYYQSIYKGKIGINLVGEMMWPYNKNDKKDVDATERGLTFQVDWFADPLFKGDYPPLMKKIVGSRLPTFTEEEKTMLKGSIDFFAMNHYTSYLVQDGGSIENISYFDDVNITHRKKREWKQNELRWMIVPEGMYWMLHYVYDKWVKNKPMEIWITENGMPVKEPNLQKALSDYERVEYMQTYLEYLWKAREEGIPVTKYFGWSLLDNFEWQSGLSVRFGLVRINYKDKEKRTPKRSMNWYSQLIQGLN